MRGYTVYNQSGGQAKSTITRDLAAAHAEAGKRVLILDLDAQNGSISNYLGVDDDKHDENADALTLHLIDRGKDDFDKLIRNAEENIDVIPSHKRLNDLSDYLNNYEAYIGADKPDDWKLAKHELLYKTLKKNDVIQDYDILIADPNAKADMAYYMALYATRSVVIPAVPTRSGYESIEGVSDSAKNFAKISGINIGRVAVVPVMVDMRKGGHKDYAKKLRDEYDAPIYFRLLTPFEDAEDQYETVFKHLKNKKRVSSSQSNILPKYRTLAAHIHMTLNDPLPAGTWNKDELFTGDDFWGSVDVPFSPAEEQQPKAIPEVN